MSIDAKTGKQAKNPRTKEPNMTVHNLKLIAPNSLPIIGIKLNDGSLSDFEYSYDDHAKTFMYILPSGNASAIGATTVLVDSGGNEWASGDVEFHSLLHR